MSRPFALLPVTGRAVETSSHLTWSGVSDGFSWSRIAAAPATCGAATDVPFMRT